MSNYFAKTKAKLISFSIQRDIWIKFSFLFFIAIVLFITEWADIIALKNKFLRSGIFIFFSCISVCWWYWTMNLIKKLLTFRQEELTILEEISKDIKNIKNDVKNM